MEDRILYRFVAYLFQSDTLFSPEGAFFDIESYICNFL